MREPQLVCLQLEKCSPFPKTNKWFYRCISIPLLFYVYIISREAYFHIKSDDGYFLANRSGCGVWYHKKCMNIQVKVFWDKKDRMQWKCSVCRKYVIRIGPDLKICWFVVTRVIFFEYKRPAEKFFLSFWDGKDSINSYL